MIPSPGGPPRGHKPLVTVIMPTLNEDEAIGAALDSILGQDLPSGGLEILVVDGGSTDQTVQVIERRIEAGEPVQLLHNADGRTPHAFNIGLDSAQAEWVAILGAHTHYDVNYLTACLAEMRRTGAVGCSGTVKVQPADERLGARLSASVMANPFGSSTRSFRTLKPGFVHSVPYAVFNRQALLDLGGYNERFTRNQDNDMNERLLASGHQLYLTDLTCAHYRAPSSLRRLFRYAFRNGRWNAQSFFWNPRALRPHHLAPLAFLGALVASSALAFSGGVRQSVGVFLLIGALGVHGAVGTTIAIAIALTRRRLWPIALPICFLGFHLAYGVGSTIGIVTRASAATS